MLNIVWNHFKHDKGLFYFNIFSTVLTKVLQFISVTCTKHLMFQKVRLIHVDLNYWPKLTMTRFLLLSFLSCSAFRTTFDFAFLLSSVKFIEFGSYSVPKTCNDHVCNLPSVVKITAGLYTCTFYTQMLNNHIYQLETRITWAMVLVGIIMDLQFPCTSGVLAPRVYSHKGPLVKTRGGIITWSVIQQGWLSPQRRN